jgi:hypothetical protein
MIPWNDWFRRHVRDMSAETGKKILIVTRKASLATRCCWRWLKWFWTRFPIDNHGLVGIHGLIFELKF